MRCSRATSSWWNGLGLPPCLQRFWRQWGAECFQLDPSLRPGMQEVVTRADVAIVEYCPYLVTGRLDLILSLRGLYFMDGNPLLEDVVSFAGVGGGPARCW